MEFFRSFLNSFEQPVVHLPLVFILSIILARLSGYILDIVSHLLISRTRTDFDDKVLRVLKRPLAGTIFLSGLWFMLSLSNLSDDLHAPFSNAIHTGLILVISLAVIKVAAEAIEHFSQSKEKYAFIQPQSKPAFNLFTKLVVIGGAFYFFSIIWNLDVTAWLASAGIVGIAVGFAAKDTLANLLSGVLIMADRPYKIGDYIVLDGGVRGRVTNIGLRSTRVLTRDDVEVIVPNGIIGNSTIVNESGGPYEKYRIRVSVGVAYGSDVDRVEEVLMTVADTLDIVEKIPTPRVRFRELGDSSLNFELLVWVARPELRGLANHQLLGAIYKALNEAKIEIPYPKRDVYLHTVNEQ